MTKQAPKPLPQEQINKLVAKRDGKMGAQGEGVAQARQLVVDTASNNSNVDAPAHSYVPNEHIEIRAEHQDMSLRDLQARSRELREQKAAIDLEQKSVDEAISIKHQAIAQAKRITKLSPEDIDDVLSGRAEFGDDVPEALETQVLESTPEQQQ